MLIVASWHNFTAVWASDLVASSSELSAAILLFPRVVECPIDRSWVCLRMRVTMAIGKELLATRLAQSASTSSPRFGTFWESNSDVDDIFLHLLRINSFTVTR
jgi:hypothetical protein